MNSSTASAIFLSRQKIGLLMEIVLNHAEVVPGDTDIAIPAGAIKADRKKTAAAWTPLIV